MQKLSDLFWKWNDEAAVKRYKKIGAWTDLPNGNGLVDMDIVFKDGRKRAKRFCALSVAAAVLGNVCARI